MARIRLAAIVDAGWPLGVIPADELPRPVGGIADEPGSLRDAPPLAQEPEQMPVGAGHGIVRLAVAMGQLIGREMRDDGEVAGHDRDS